MDRDDRAGETTRAEMPARLAVDRRTLLGGVAAAGLTAVLGGAAEAQAPASTRHRIDVHHHLAPPNYASFLTAHNQLVGPLKGWSLERTIEDMDRGGVTTAILSITPPGASLGEVQDGRRLVRDCNEYMAKLVTSYRGRFGMFVMLPFPDVEGSLQEIAYGLDVLKADGIGMFTNYGDKWLGDPSLNPVWEELNRRKAVVYTHPTAANCCRNLVPGVPPALIEYGTDTTRSIAQLVFSGAAARYPNIRFIFSHAGGTMPFLIERFDFQARAKDYKSELPHGVRYELRKFYYDTAQAFAAPAMWGLKKVVPMSQIVFGTDFPFRTAEEHVKGLKECGVFDAKQLAAIDGGNAGRLFPRFKA
jgi:6-methylsalicylate decarboxylase